MDIANVIKEIRKALGLTQIELAERIGSNRFNIANYETGRAIPPANVFVKIQDLDPARDRRPKKKR